MAMARMALAIDIGGTKLAVGLVDESGHVTWRAAAPTPATADPHELWGTLATLVGRAPSAGQTVCGVGCGGPMALGGERVSPLNIKAWRDFPLRSKVAGLTGLATFVDNDAKALALGEGWRGAAKGG